MKKSLTPLERTTETNSIAASAGSEAIDDYLKAIFQLSGRPERQVSSTEIAAHLSITAASVTNMLQKLAAQEPPLVVYEKHYGVKLAKAGKRRALEIIRHHRLLETFLHQVLDYPWDEVHQEAERLEHAVSPAFEARLIEKLGEQGTCPHGNTVLPESPSQRRKRGLIQLSEAAEKTDYLVSALYERDPKLLVFLYQSGISPNTRVRLLAKNYDQTVSIETPMGAITLGRPAAERVWVKRLTAKDSPKDSIK